MSGYFCLGIHPVMLGHRGHFLHSSEDMPIHVILPTCPTHTHTSSASITHTYTHRLGSRCAVLLAQSELPAEGRALPWQRAKKGQMKQRRGINAPLPYLLGNLHLQPLTTNSVTESRCRSNSLSRTRPEKRERCFFLTLTQLLISTNILISELLKFCVKSAQQ